MPEEELFKTEGRKTRSEIAKTLRDAADQIESESVRLGSGTESVTASLPERPLFEVELERLTDSETEEEQYELEYEIRWTESA